MERKLKIKDLLSVFTLGPTLKNATDREKAELSRKQNLDSYNKTKIATLVFIFVQVFFIISDLTTDFYNSFAYSYLNLAAELMLLLSSVVTLSVLTMLTDRTDKLVGNIQFVYYVFVETGVMLYFAGDILRDVSNVTNSFYNMVVLVIFAIYSFKQIAMLTAYIFAGTLTILITLSDKFVWANYQLLIVLLILFFSCTNYFRVNNSKYFYSESRLENMAGTLRELSSRDFLTKLSNRTALSIYIDHEAAKTIERGEAVSLMMLDIDDFKAYNDYYSHLAGDECLTRLGGALLGLENDRFRAFRYGGEEFLISGIGVDEEDVKEYAQRVISCIRSMRIPREDTEKGYITVSIGTSLGKLKEPNDFFNLLRVADKELYLAKKNGKDCYYYMGTKSS